MNQIELDAEKEHSEPELRPGGILVQRRENDDNMNQNDGNINHYDDGKPAAGGPMIKIKVSYGSSLYDLSVSSQSTFGDLKKVFASELGLEPQKQRLFFRGREKDDAEVLQTAGIKDLSKLLLMEHPVSKAEIMEDKKKKNEIFKACEAVAEVRGEVDKLSEKVAAIQASVNAARKVDENEFIVSTELLMRQLLKLDSIGADGEARAQRKTEVSRVQSYVDTLDALKARNTNPFGDCSNAMSVTTEWEAFDSGVGSLTAPPSMLSTKITQDWEQFD